MITLASDFGTPYPAAMKGVLCQRTDAQLVDVGHDFPRGDIHATAFWLREVLPYFPPATHLVVVDPGVGTDRDAVVVRAGEHVLVGPDNGVTRPAARVLASATEGPIEAFRIDETATESLLEIPHMPEPTGKFSQSGRSETFHGRDVFAPAAAAVHDVSSDRLADLEGLSAVDSVESLVDCELPEATVESGPERAVGDVLVVDDFGNVITNVPGAFLEGRDSIEANGSRVPVGTTFASVPSGERLATVGSHGYVELDVNDGRGDDAFGLEPGDDVILEP